MCLQEEVKLPIWRKMNREDSVIIAGLAKDVISASGAVSLLGMANGFVKGNAFENVAGEAIE